MARGAARRLGGNHKVIQKRVFNVPRHRVFHTKRHGDHIRPGLKLYCFRALGNRVAAQCRRCLAGDLHRQAIFTGVHDGGLDLHLPGFDVRLREDILNIHRRRHLQTNRRDDPAAIIEISGGPGIEHIAQGRVGHGQAIDGGASDIQDTNRQPVGGSWFYRLGHIDLEGTLNALMSYQMHAVHPDIRLVVDGFEFQEVASVGIGIYRGLEIQPAPGQPMIIREDRLDDPGNCDRLGLFCRAIKPFVGNAGIVWIDVHEPLVSVQRNHLLAARAQRLASDGHGFRRWRGRCGEGSAAQRGECCEDCQTG